MSSQINRVPFGFLSLIDSQNMGRNPAQLLPEVRGIVDMRPFYVQDAQRIAHNSVNVTQPNQAAELTVPNNEIWDLMNISSMGTIAGSATATIRYALTLDTKSTTAASGRATCFLASGPESQPVYDTVSNARTVHCCFCPPQPLFAYPGDILAALCIDILLAAEANIPTQIRCLYRRYVIA
jgi:hypothetical protein